MGIPDWDVSIVNIHLRKLLLVYCPGHAGVKGNDRADRLAGKATLTSGLLLGRSEELRSLRHYLRAQSQGHHTIEKTRGKWKRSTTFLGRTRDGHRQSDEHWNILRMYLWWSLCTLFLLACQVRVAVGDSGLCCNNNNR